MDEETEARVLVLYTGCVRFHCARFVHTSPC